MECEVQERMKNDLEERNSSLSRELDLLRYAFSQSLFNFETNANNKMGTSIFREPEEPQETTADADPHVFASSGYF